MVHNSILIWIPSNLPLCYCVTNTSSRIFQASLATILCLTSAQTMLRFNCERAKKEFSSSPDLLSMISGCLTPSTNLQSVSKKQRCWTGSLTTRLESSPVYIVVGRRPDRRVTSVRIGAWPFVFLTFNLYCNFLQWYVHYILKGVENKLFEK